MILCLNAGHGGTDSGATAFNQKESMINLKIVLEAEKHLKALGHTVIMTRQNDEFISLENICRIANNAKADYFLSCHINAAGGTGYESFVYKLATAHTVMFGKGIHEYLSKFYKAHGFKDRGFQKANFFVLRHTGMPACLIENLFIDNINDEKFIVDNIPLIGKQVAAAFIYSILMCDNYIKTVEVAKHHYGYLKGIGSYDCLLNLVHDIADDLRGYKTNDSGTTRV